MGTISEVPTLKKLKSVDVDGCEIYSENLCDPRWAKLKGCVSASKARGTQIFSKILDDFPAI